MDKALVSKLKDARSRLSEAESPKKKSTAWKNAPPSENPAGDALEVANSFRALVKAGDSMLERMSEAVKFAKALVAAGDDDLAAKRAAVDLEKAAKALVATAAKEGPIYAPFARGRDLTYSLAALWNVGTGPSDTGKGAKPKASVPFYKQVPGMKSEDLLAYVEKAAGRLQGAYKDMLDSGARAQNLMRALAKKIGLEKGEVSGNEAVEAVHAALAFRDAVSSALFGAVTGMNTAVEELLRRARQKEAFESRLPWETPEFVEQLSI